MGAIRDVVLFPADTPAFSGFISLVVVAFDGQPDSRDSSRPGFAGSAVAHTMHVWNFLGMALAGLAFALAGGCPGRQLFLAGEGDGDAAVFVTGNDRGCGFRPQFRSGQLPQGGRAPRHCRRHYRVSDSLPVHRIYHEEKSRLKFRTGDMVVFTSCNRAIQQQSMRYGLPLMQEVFPAPAGD